MRLAFWKKDKVETRSVMASGYTSAILAARENWISGASGLGELTGCVQSCISLWENGLSISEVSGTELLTPAVLAIVARSLALRGESVWYVTPDRLIACSDWDLSTRYGQPKAYRLSVGEAGGAQSITALAAETLHFRIGSDAYSPWSGTAPLARAKLTAGLLHSLESALSEVFENAPIGSQVLPFPESPTTDLEKLGAQFRAKRGRLLLRESVNVTASGGPGPQSDWSPNGLSPDISKSMTGESLQAAKDSILAVFGVLPGLFNGNTTGPMVREAQRHLCQFQLQPICNLLAAECSEKLDSPVTLDCLQPLAAFDVGARSRSLGAIVEALAKAKEAGVDPAQALALVNWDT